jgi:hypothetical protein
MTMKIHKDTNTNIQRELKELGSSLKSAKKQAEFEVPANYFDQLPGNIQNKINQNTGKTEYGLAAVLNKRLIPVFASVLLVFGITISLFLYDRNGAIEYVAEEDKIPEYEYFAYRPNFDRDMMYGVILESDLSADDILFSEENNIFDDADDELLDDIFERAQYYGIEDQLLLSYFD